MWKGGSGEINVFFICFSGWERQGFHVSRRTWQFDLPWAADLGASEGCLFPQPRALTCWEQGHLRGPFLGGILAFPCWVFKHSLQVLGRCPTVRGDKQGKTGRFPYEVGRKRNQRLLLHGGWFFFFMTCLTVLISVLSGHVAAHGSSLWPVPSGFLPVGRGALLGAGRAKRGAWCIRRSCSEVTSRGSQGVRLSRGTGECFWVPWLGGGQRNLFSRSSCSLLSPSSSWSIGVSSPWQETLVLCWKKWNWTITVHCM